MNQIALAPCGPPGKEDSGSPRPKNPHKIRWYIRFLRFRPGPKSRCTQFANGRQAGCSLSPLAILKTPVGWKGNRASDKGDEPSIGRHKARNPTLCRHSPCNILITWTFFQNHQLHRGGKMADNKRTGLRWEL